MKYRSAGDKTTEYRRLKGGEKYEPVEQNPFLGYRGAHRYLADPEVFELELKAIKQVRDLGYTNLHLMLPFVRNVPELVRVKKLIEEHGLKRNSKFKLWMMVEIPSNVILLDTFIEAGIDGISIGTNDLTMLMLGVDRDNELLASSYNEMDPAVLWCMRRAIETANSYQITSSVCGQAPSQYSELVEKLVHWGVTSISVNPDVVEHTREVVMHAEHKFTSNERYNNG